MKCVTLSEKFIENVNAKLQFDLGVGDWDVFFFYISDT